MKKIISLFSMALMSFGVSVAQDCELPGADALNTGANMTVMLAPNLISSLNTTDESAYLVAFSADGFLVGSAVVGNVPQNTIAVWGNDASTDQIDGALAGDLITFQLVDGTDLYDVSMPNATQYTTNGMVIQATPAVVTIVDCSSNEDVLGCTDSSANNYNTDATVDDSSCTYDVLGCTDSSANNYNTDATVDDSSCTYDSTDDCILPSSDVVNTGANMTVMLTPALINSLNTTDDAAYLVAFSPDGYVVGSAVVGNVSQNTIAVWGDDASTDQMDGASAGDTITFQLVDGTSLFNVEMPAAVLYTTNGLSNL